MARNCRPGRQGPPAGHYDPDAGVRYDRSGANAGEGKRGPGAQNRHGESAGRRASPVGDARRLARCLACPDSAGPTDASQASVRLSALRHPFLGVSEAKGQNPGAKNAPRE
jgi:hypothetical protein